MRVLALALASVLLAGCAVPAEEPAVPAAQATPEPAPATEAPPTNGTDAEETAGAANVTSDDASAPPEPERGLVIAVVDSGIRPDHASFAPGQVVAWYDFTTDDERPLASWDPLVAEPYDDDGHGTAVASVAAGLPVEGVTPSHAPGAKLAIARVLPGGGTATWVDIGAAIRWAADVAGADVVTVSIYSHAAMLDDAAFDYAEDAHAAVEHARARGVLVTLLAGNGLGNQGVVPAPSWMHPPLSSNAALVVGGANADGSPTSLNAQGARSGLDPEVTALYHVGVACPEDATCVSRKGGTSFSTPLVAGMAARILAEARAVGRGFGPEELEAILKRVAHDTDAPPNAEGYGFLDAASLEAALAHVRDGTPLPEPATPLNEAYVETTQPFLRDAWRGSPPSAP